MIVLQDERSDDERIHVVTIYDWKIGYNYCGEEEGIDVEDNSQWNVGSHSMKSLDLLDRYLLEKGYSTFIKTNRKTNFPMSYRH